MDENLHVYEELHLDTTVSVISNQNVTTCIAKKLCETRCCIRILVVSFVSVIIVFAFVKIGVELFEISQKLNTEIANVNNLEVKINLLKSLLNSTQLKLEFISRDTSSEIEKLRSRMDEHNDRITKHDEKVAITSCISSEGNKSSGEILKFDDVITEIGINQSSALNTSGKFTFVKRGLYQISVFIATHGRKAQYSVHTNRKLLSKIYITDQAGTFNAGTLVVAVELQVGDNIWVQTNTDMFVLARKWSCITIVKIK